MNEIKFDFLSEVIDKLISEKHYNKTSDVEFAKGCDELTTKPIKWFKKIIRKLIIK
jgi:hypothetical protein